MQQFNIKLFFYNFSMSHHRTHVQFISQPQLSQFIIKNVQLIYSLWILTFHLFVNSFLLLIRLVGLLLRL